MTSVPIVGHDLLPDHQRMVKVLLGSCLFVFRGDTRCPCASGSLVIQAHSLSTGGTCDDCGHLVSRHQDYAPSPPDSPSALSQDISPRSDTVRKLAALLDKKRVVHVRGPPSSGKTTLARLLELYYNEQGQSVKFIKGWNDNIDDGTQQHQDQQEKSHRFYIENRLHTNTVIIIDEAQESFADHALWLGPIKAQIGAVGGARISILSSYGSPTSGSPYYPDAQVPLYLEPSQRVSITEQPGVESSGICLFYNEDEFEDAVNRLCSSDTTFNIDSSARAYLYSMTKGHPGAVEAAVSYIFKSYEQAIEDGSIRTVTKELFSKLFHDESRVFRGLRHSTVFRSFPLSKDLTVSAVNVLHKVLEDGSVPCNLQDEGVRLCYEKGWLHSDLTKPSSDSEGPNTICFLPTRLHMKFVEYTLHASQLEPFPYGRFPSLATLCAAILKRFSRARLLSSPNPSDLPRTGKLIRPPETPFQDEWYRCFSSLVGHAVGISSKWSRVGTERVDFRIIGPAWGVELLRDGDQIHSVCARFQPHGLYRSLVDEGKMADWLILDCRLSVPQKYHIPGTKLWRVIFKDDYTSAYVLGSDNEVVVPEFVLCD